MPSRKSPEQNPSEKTPPVNDSSRDVCRFFVQGKCKRKERCRFYHPRRITQIMKKRALKELGKCYCGATQVTVVNRTLWRYSDNDDKRSQFFVVCGRTRKSIKRCV